MLSYIYEQEPSSIPAEFQLYQIASFIDISDVGLFNLSFSFFLSSDFKQSEDRLFSSTTGLGIAIGFTSSKYPRRTRTSDLGHTVVGKKEPGTKV